MGALIRFVSALWLAFAISASSLATAQPPGPPPGPPGPPPMAQADVAAAPAGVYEIDPRHTSVLARVPHMGFSFSVFRFGAVSGSLEWDPADPAASKLVAEVATSSIQTPVAGFAEELTGERFLKSAQFPTARFEATSFRRSSATQGRVEGQLTLMGVTRPVGFDVELVGAGQGMMGAVIGVTGAASITTPSEFGLPAMLSQPVQIVIDAEFVRRRQ